MMEKGNVSQGAYEETKISMLIIIIGYLVFQSEHDVPFKAVQLHCIRILWTDFV